MLPRDNLPMNQSIPKSVDEHMAMQPETVRPKLEQVHAAIREAVPEAVEGIGYGMPDTSCRQTVLYFASFKDHYSPVCRNRNVLRGARS